MATIREKRPGYWEVRVFTGRGSDGNPTQVSKVVRGTKRDAQRIAASLDARPTSNAAGRTVGDTLDSWRETNEPLWTQATKRDYVSRLKQVQADSIASVSLAGLSVSDVERWHARMRRNGIGEAAIRGRHQVLRAAVAQAVRWEWIATNPVANARLRQPRSKPREAMSPDEVRRVIAAATTIDPMAGLALRLAAVAGARRAEVAALRWDEVDDGKITIDSSVEEVSNGDRSRTYVDAPTKTGNTRVVRLDRSTLDEIAALRTEREAVSPFMFSLDASPAPPARIGWWWTRAREIAKLDKKWRLHDLRHWSATIGISSGHDVRTVAGRLGHANPAMTLRVYAHAVENADASLAAHLGHLLD